MTFRNRFFGGVFRVRACFFRREKIGNLAGNRTAIYFGNRLCPFTQG
jgi:hypothetical protein